MTPENRPHGAALRLAASCMVIFWPGVFIFGFPGVMAPYWQKAFGVGRGEVGRTLFFLLAAVGIFMFISGRLQERVKVRYLALFGSFSCGCAIWFVGYAVSMKMVYLWAFWTGMSVSFILIPALTVAQQWYPFRRGLASGLVNLAFGLSAAVMSPLVSLGFQALGYQPLTRILAICALVTGCVSASFLRRPVAFSTADKGHSAGSSRVLGMGQTLQAPAFWCLWLVWGLAGAAGIATVTLSTTFGIARGLTLEQAVLILTAFNVTNGASRLIAGHLSDTVGRRLTMGLTFGAAGLGYLLLPNLTGLGLWMIAAAVVGFAFGTLFAVSAPLIVDCFGMARFGPVFGLIFTAYAFVAGPLGPWLSGYLLDRTGGNFTVVFTYLGSLCLVSTVLIHYVRPPRL